MASSMEEVYKFETETLRRITKQCAELLFKYGHTFEKEDRDKSIELLAVILNRKDFVDICGNDSQRNNI